MSYRSRGRTSPGSLLTLWLCWWGFLIACFGGAIWANYVYLVPEFGTVSVFAGILMSLGFAILEVLVLKVLISVVATVVVVFGLSRLFK